MTVHDTAADPIGRLKAMVARPFEEARAMPPEVYTSEAFLAAEQERIFARDWVCAGRADQLSRPGDYLTLDIAGRPVMVLRDGEGRLRAQSNVCLHRMSTLLEGTGNTRTIVCPYHAWTYGLDGQLRGAPAMGRNRAFRRDGQCLPQLACQDWQGWIMVSLDPDAPPVAERLAAVDALIGDFGMKDYVLGFHEVHHWNTNWKVLAENFMESYHLPVCHAATVGAYSKLEEMECPPGEPAFNYHWILKDGRLGIATAHPSNSRIEGEERRRTTFLLTVYPNLLVTLTPGYFWYLALFPAGTDHVRLNFGGGLSPDYVADRQAQTHFAELKGLLDRVNEEDRGCTEAVYRGLSSGLARPGHLSHLERPLYDFATYLAGQLG